MFVAQIWEAPYVAKSNECACNEIDSEVHCPVPDRHTKVPLVSILIQVVCMHCLKCKR